MQGEQHQLSIDGSTLEQVLNHLADGLPFERCGLLATVTNPRGAREVQRFFPGDNIERSPHRFTMSPRQVSKALRELDQRGWDLGAIVHSHPTGPATPSRTDLREVFYPNAWMVIVAYEGRAPDVRVWRLERLGGVHPVEVGLTIDPG